MFYTYIPLFSYMGTNLGQMPAAAALRLLRLRLEIPAADRGSDSLGVLRQCRRNLTFYLPPPLRMYIILAIFMAQVSNFRGASKNAYSRSLSF